MPKKERYPEWIKTGRNKEVQRYAARMTAKRIVLVCEVPGHWGGTEEAEQAYHQREGHAAWERFGHGRHAYHFPAWLTYHDGWTASPTLSARLDESKHAEILNGWQSIQRQFEARARRDKDSAVKQAEQAVLRAARADEGLLLAGAALRQADRKPWQRFVEPVDVANLNARRPVGFDEYVVPAVIWKCDTCFMPAESGRLDTRNKRCARPPGGVMGLDGKQCCGRLLVSS